MTVVDMRLSDSVTIPQLGFGVFQVEPDQTQQAVETALEVGYRHIDTARIYRNERAVGAALSASGLARDEVFVTTKLWNSHQGYDDALRAFDTALDRLGIDVLDLFLIHWPAPELDRYVDTWRAFEQLLADGRVRAIGVSNFRVEDLQRLADLGMSTPTINQIELHPLLTQSELRSYHREHGIVTEAWSPLAQGAALTEPVVTEIASRHGATPAQVVIAWHLAIGNVVIPKSVTPSRIASNFAATSVQLSDVEVARISALDVGRRTGMDPAVFNGA